MALKINRTVSRIGQILGWALVAIIAVLLIKTYVWEKNYYATKTNETRAKADVVITEIETILSPSEFEPSEDEIKEYQVEANNPRYLDIPRLDLHARVRHSAVDNNKLPLPNDVYDVAWFAGSSAPGQGGNVLISGLYKGSTKDGVFKNLDSLEKGDEIIIERGDGEKFTYEVRELQIVDAKDAANELPGVQRRIDDKETLSLVTARTYAEGGEYESIVMLRATIK